MHVFREMHDLAPKMVSQHRILVNLNRWPLFLNWPKPPCTMAAAGAWRPTLPVLFMTGYAENAMQRSRFLGTGMDMITKPFEIDGLLASVHAMFD